MIGLVIGRYAIGEIPAEFLIGEARAAFEAYLGNEIIGELSIALELSIARKEGS